MQFHFILPIEQLRQEKARRDESFRADNPTTKSTARHVPRGAAQLRPRQRLPILRTQFNPGCGPRECCVESINANFKHGPVTIIRSAAPTFLVHDVAATARWYLAHLGFRLAGFFPNVEPYAYASIQRDNAEIMLLNLPGYKKPDVTALRPAGVWDVYLRTDGVRALFETMRGQPFIREELVQRPYGDWEFEVLDPNGYIVVFGGSQ